ncbi:Restriction endonuclease [Pedobacter steynii]|uniref:Restriction endonuclease n=1 Tax=Pedobacter steynii TaxID=430522 RepID=A0A1H0G3P6_9SPHI|nr:ImmA/IrrE family metallo-endopeptidase [Pedobacter steynii]NQX42312.1 ImmA/IrrE family metallo-endopeptidase [Pedobacter steynii]SDO01482.1 Restriction endonuclease [Pedobacter steynii]
MNKSNTVSRGNRFEERGYDLIKAAVERLEFGVLPECCKIFRKKKYYSKELEDYIEFDLSVEIWLPGAEDYSFVYLIECKDYRTKIPGNDITEFINNVRLVQGLRVKAVVITTTELQPRALKLAQSQKIMWILVKGDSHVTKLYSSSRKKDIDHDTDLLQINKEIAQLQEISSLLFSGEESKIEWDGFMEMLVKHSLEGNLPAQTEDTETIKLERLSSEKIKIIANNILDDFDPNIRKHFLALNTEEFIAYLQNKHGVEVKHESIPYDNGRDNSGAFIPETKTILIDNSIVGTDRYKYILAHEAGHFFLHGHLKIDQKKYDNQEDSKYNHKTKRHQLLNERNFLEWQASKFATCLVMPDLSVMVKLILHQKKNNINHEGRMFVDHVAENLQIFTVTIDALRNFFEVSEIVMEYRLADLNILKYGKQFKRPRPTYQTLTSRVKTIGQLLGQVFSDMELKFTNNMTKTTE